MPRTKTKRARAPGAAGAKRGAKGGTKPQPADYLRLDEQLCFPICLAARLVVNAYRPLLEKLEITHAQYLVLLVLWERDGLSVGALGERLHLDTGTLTPLLKRMERQGLVRRRRNVEDDRVVENWLSEAGKSLKKRAEHVPVGLLCNAGLDMDDVRSIKGVIEGFVNRLLAVQGSAS